MGIALLTMDRGDRMPLYNHCLEQVSRFVTPFAEHIKIVHPPKNDQVDLRDRVYEGYLQAKEKGYTWIVVIESDDYYKSDYLLRMWSHFDASDFIGSEFTIYYNLRNRTWERSHHPNHSSLFTTAFRVEAMKDFKWHLAHKTFLDLDIWKYARRFRRSFTDLPAIGIKHNLGKVGGNGHVQTFPNKDPELTWLKSKVDENSFEFYSKLELK
jgi:hypothetical protein